MNLDTEINTLLAYLRDFKVVDLVQEHYSKYNNTSPPILLQMQIDKLQKYLDRGRVVNNG